MVMMMMTMVIRIMIRSWKCLNTGYGKDAGDHRVVPSRSRSPSLSLHYQIASNIHYPGQGQAPPSQQRDNKKTERERERENFFPKPNDEMVRVGGRRRCQTPVRRDVVRTAVLLFVRGLERSSRNISVTASKNEKENAIKWRPFSPSRQARAAFSPRICIYFLFYISVFPGYSFLYKAVMNGHWLEGCRY